MICRIKKSQNDFFFRLIKVNLFHYLILRNKGRCQKKDRRMKHPKMYYMMSKVKNNTG